MQNDDNDKAAAAPTWMVHKTARAPKHRHGHGHGHGHRHRNRRSRTEAGAEAVPSENNENSEEPEVTQVSTMQPPPSPVASVMTTKPLEPVYMKQKKKKRPTQDENENAATVFEAVNAPIRPSYAKSKYKPRSDIPESSGGGDEQKRVRFVPGETVIPNPQAGIAAKLSSYFSADGHKASNYAPGSVIHITDVKNRGRAESSNFALYASMTFNILLIVCLVANFLFFWFSGPGNNSSINCTDEIEKFINAMFTGLLNIDENCTSDVFYTLSDEKILLAWQTNSNVSQTCTDVPSAQNHYQATVNGIYQRLVTDKCPEMTTTTTTTIFTPSAEDKKCMEKLTDCKFRRGIEQIASNCSQHDSTEIAYGIWRLCRSAAYCTCNETCSASQVDANVAFMFEEYQTVLCPPSAGATIPRKRRKPREL